MIPSNSMESGYPQPISNQPSSSRKNLATRNCNSRTRNRGKSTTTTNRFQKTPISLYIVYLPAQALSDPACKPANPTLPDSPVMPIVRAQQPQVISMATTIVITMAATIITITTTTIIAIIWMVQATIVHIHPPMRLRRPLRLQWMAMVLMEAAVRLWN